MAQRQVAWPQRTRRDGCRRRPLRPGLVPHLRLGDRAPGALPCHRGGGVPRVTATIEINADVKATGPGGTPARPRDRRHRRLPRRGREPAAHRYLAQRRDRRRRSPSWRIDYCLESFLAPPHPDSQLGSTKARCPQRNHPTPTWGKRDEIRDAPFQWIIAHAPQMSAIYQGGDLVTS